MESHLLKKFELGNKKGMKNFDYFLRIATIIARESDDPKHKVGCVLTNDKNEIIGTGYNKLPKENALFNWNEDDKSLVIHAEMSALLNRVDNNMNKELFCYSTMQPCLDCMKHLVASGCKQFYYLDKMPEKYNTPQAQQFIEIYKNDFQIFQVKNLENVVYSNKEGKNEISHI